MRVGRSGVPFRTVVAPKVYIPADRGVKFVIQSDVPSHSELIQKAQGDSIWGLYCV